ncbi:hypothetical protein, variant 1 [Exophiala mesophila]|uniref:Transcription factor domain-containing protein n=1 Tax=Exophiala mesophila TaxID=212818 RepID=A0A0D1XK45_EXOME|nr:hypothetical protein, variant 1 [Exophiala mesophila]KIV88556.1 hypothetical protein, variant 1 [Exophiala mesophila]
MVADWVDYDNPVQRDGIHAVPMFDLDRDRFCQTLMRIAFSNDSLASKAVLQSILALSSLYRDGLQPLAVQLKDAALQALMVSVNAGVHGVDAIGHVVAGILSCCFEMQLKSNGEIWNSQWVGHIVGVKELIRDIKKPCHHPPGSDNSIILNWVYYFDVATRFSLRHWRTVLGCQSFPELVFDPAANTSCRLQTALVRASFSTPVPQLSEHAPPVLALLGEICGTILYPWDSQYHSIEYQDYLGKLETRLETLELSDSRVGNESEDDIKITDLFRLAGLIYLERTSKSFSGQSPKVEGWVNKAFAIIASIERCRQPLPIFIIGCEARSDERRQEVLRLVSKTQTDPRVRNMHELGDLLQSFWVQDDLDVESEVEYVRKVSLVVSTCAAVPIFV